MQSPLCLHSNTILRFFTEGVRTDANIECLSRFVIMLMRTWKGLHNFNSRPATTDIPDMSFVQRRSIQNALIRFSGCRCFGRCMSVVCFLFHNFHSRSRIHNPQRTQRARRFLDPFVPLRVLSGHLLRRRQLRRLFHSSIQHKKNNENDERNDDVERCVRRRNGGIPCVDLGFDLAELCFRDDIVVS